jgi:hypothetical protein
MATLTLSQIKSQAPASAVPASDGTLTLAQIQSGQQPSAAPAPPVLPQAPASAPPTSAFGATPPAPGTPSAFAPGNLKKIPGQIASGAKSLFNFFTGSEQAAGGEIASGLPASTTGEADLNKANQDNAASDVNFIKTMNALKSSGKKLTSAQQQMYDHILQTHSQVGTQTDLLPHATDTNTQALENVGGVAADVLGAGTYGKAAKGAEFGKLLPKAAPSVLTKATDAADAAKALLTKSPEKVAATQGAKVADVVAPKMSARETADALAARGGTKTGILGTIKANPDPAVKRIAETVTKYVPDFSPKKSLVENINVTKTAASSMAKDLKAKVIDSGQDRIYSFKELGAALNKLPKPTLLVGDMEQVYGKVVNKAMEIARSNGGKVSDLFQARKEFDDFVSQEFPNLYSSDTLTPMRSAIKNVRNAMTDFTAEHLPEDVGLHESLTHQSRLLQAIENMSEKAASGADKEVGTNALERGGAFLRKHPVIGAAAGAAGYEEAKKLPIVGQLLP